MREERVPGMSVTNKDFKFIAFKGSIGENDFLIKVNNVKKWLSKGLPVKVTINFIPEIQNKAVSYYFLNIIAFILKQG